MFKKSCPAGCGDALVMISAKAGEREISLQSCPSCDGRWWYSGAEAIVLDRVLEQIERSPLRRPGLPRLPLGKAS